MTGLATLLRGDMRSDRIVPRSGIAASLTLFTAGVMAFLAVFALALSLAAGELAQRWSDALARTSTIRVSAQLTEREDQVFAVLRILDQTPGVASARALSEDEQRALLAPWFGPDLPLEALPVPSLIEIAETQAGYDAEGLRQRLTAAVPGAVLDDHARWRRPLVVAADRIRAVGWISLVLITATVGAMVTLAAQAALSANAQVIAVMRLVGARDVTIARAFVRRFTLRGFLGAVVGAAAGVVAVALVPAAGADAAFLDGLGFDGLQWGWPAAIPLFAALVAFWATRGAALRTLRRLT